jgi:hypothetical protein
MISSLMTGKLEKLEISVVGQSSSKFSAQVNPSSFKHGLSINYNGDQKNCDTDKATGTASSDLQFKDYGSEDVSFELLLDGTGGVGPMSSMFGPSKSVSDLLDELKTIIYKYDGTKHQPNVVELAWGKFVFECRLKTMSVDYTLFKPDGSPLRAKISLAFVSYTTVKKQAAEENKSSPDLSHYIEVSAGDTLPLLCQQVYEQPRYYLKVAEFNGLANFRCLEPGSVLIFPPLN